MARIIEIMEAAESNPASIMEHKDNTYLRKFMTAAYLQKMNLPEGDPPYKENAMDEYQVPTGAFWQFARNCDKYFRTDVPKIKLETNFINDLESVSKKEAKLILAAKDHKIHKLYKGLTLKKLQEVGYFPSN